MDLVLPLFVGTAYVVNAFVHDPYRGALGAADLAGAAVPLAVPRAPADSPGWGTIDVTPGVELGWHPHHAAAYSETPTAGISRNVMACADIHLRVQCMSDRPVDRIRILTEGRRSRIYPQGHRLPAASRSGPARRGLIGLSDTVARLAAESAGAAPKSAIMRSNLMVRPGGERHAGDRQARRPQGCHLRPR
jgi:hypothetical protein